MRDAELTFPFDLVWLPTCQRLPVGGSAPILPMPEEDYPVCADWHLVHLSPLVGTVATLEEVGAYYRVHGANNYEPGSAVLDLDHVRAKVEFARQTSADLLALAAELGIPHPSRILSVADLGPRLISLRLDPAHHPIATDTRRGLLRDTLGAVKRRDNASAALKLAFLGLVRDDGGCAPPPRRAARGLVLLPRAAQCGEWCAGQVAAALIWFGGGARDGKGRGHLGGGPGRLWPPPRWPRLRGRARVRAGAAEFVREMPGTSPGGEGEVAKVTTPPHLQMRGRPLVRYSGPKVDRAPGPVEEPSRDPHVRGGRFARPRPS